MAVNCFLVPKAMLGLVGSSAIDTSVALVTSSVVVPETLPSVAVIVVLPAATVVAKPLVLGSVALLTVATARLDESQTTEPVMSCVVLSE